MNQKSKSQFEQYLDEKAKDKAKKPEIFISKRIGWDWDWWLLKKYKKLFKKGD